MLTVEQLRRIYPDCEGRSDEEVLRAYHAKFYPDTDYERFLAQHEAAAEARRGRSGGRSGKSGESGKSQKGPDPRKQLYDRLGYGIDKETGNPYPYLRDENKKFVRNEKGERELDYDAGVPSDEVLAELERKANGQGLQRPQQAEQAASPTSLDADVDLAVAEAENYEDAYLSDAILQGVPGMQDEKRVALQEAMRGEIGKRLVDDDPLWSVYQSEIDDVENYDSQLRRGLQGVVRNHIWGPTDPQDRDVAGYRTNDFYQREMARQAQLEAEKERQRNLAPDRDAYSPFRNGNQLRYLP